MSSEQIFQKITWKVPNISKRFLLGRSAQKEKFSESFSVFFGEDFTEWRLELIRSGIYLILVEHSTINYKVNVRLAIYNSETQNDVSGTFEKHGRQFTREFTNSNSWGFNLVGHGKVMKNFEAFVVDRSLTVVCEMKLTPEPKTVAARVDLIALSSDFSKMFLNDFAADFELIAMNDGVQAQSFKCHKFVLAQNSAVFSRMINDDAFKEAREGQCEISDLSSEAIEEILRFMYCGKIEGLVEVACELIYASEKYEMKDLKNLCIKNIMKNLHAENVIDVLKTCHIIPDTDRVFRKCVDVVVDNYQTISKKDEWNTLPQQILLKISDMVIKDSAGSSHKFISAK